MLRARRRTRLLGLISYARITNFPTYEDLFIPSEDWLVVIDKSLKHFVSQPQARDLFIPSEDRLVVIDKSLKHFATEPSA